MPTITLVQSTKGTGTALAYGSNNTVGNFLLVCLADDSGGTTTTVPTDSLGNTWLSAINVAGYGAIFYAMNCKAGANTVTLAHTATAIHIYEYSGVKTTAALDQTGNGSGSMPMTGITTAANDLMFMQNDAYDAGSTYPTISMASSGMTAGQFTNYISTDHITTQDGWIMQATSGSVGYTWSVTSGSFGAFTQIWASFFNATVTVVYPTVTTQAVTAITATTATGNGNITNLGGAANCTVEGIVYSTVTFSGVNGVTPSTYGTVVQTTGTFTTGAFTEALTSLSASTTYYVAAFAENSDGYGYGSTVSFTTSAAPVVTPVTFGFSGLIW
jgi:hypothetical protein